MRPEDLGPGAWGELEPVADGWAFVPSLAEPEVHWTPELVSALAGAERAIGELRGVARQLPSPRLLSRPFLRREATLSSRIEGTRSDLSTLLLHEAGGPTEPGSDVVEVANYVAAYELGRDLLDTLPWSLRVVRALHGRLTAGVRGGSAQPGDWRRQQVWLGGPGAGLADAEFVPPPPGPRLLALLAQWEAGLHREWALPPLLRIAALHYQFEAIHPFLDGNGRVGRLMIALMMATEELVDQPWLFLSAYFERHRDDYYRHLRAVSTHGAWADWFGFFLRAARAGADDTVVRAERLQAWRAELLAAASGATQQALVDLLFETPVVGIPAAAERLGVTWATAAKHIQALTARGVLTEVQPPRRRGRLFVAWEVVRRLEA